MIHLSSITLSTPSGESMVIAQPSFILVVIDNMSGAD